MSRIWVLVMFSLMLALGIAYTLTQYKLPALPASSKIFSSELLESGFRLRNLSLGGTGWVYGSRGGKLYRIIDDGQHTELVNSFPARISAIHERADGLLIVTTDEDHWDPQKPCTVYRSVDAGKSFEAVKTIEAGSVLWWSLASDKMGRIYVAEYGPQRIGMSKTLWRSEDDGRSWRAVYQAPDQDKVHLHRIAVDPYSDDLWLTVGDGKNRSMLTSVDHGESWRLVERLQSTAVAFDEAAIYWGRDKKGKSGVLRYDRDTHKFTNWFNPRSEGNFGGSVYDMLLLESGEMIVPFMKYPQEGHVASVWRKPPQGEWALMLQLASEEGKGTGFETIAGPDRDGWVYMRGYQIRVNTPDTATR